MTTLSAYAAVKISQQATPGEGVADYELSANLVPFYFPQGVGSGQVSVVYVGHRVAPGAARDDLLLTNSLQDVFGNKLTFGVVKGVYLLADATNTVDIVIGNATTDPFLGWFAAAGNLEHVVPGGASMHVHPGAGWTVTAAVHDQLGITTGDGATPAGYEIIIWG
ncbi:MAG TPA: hypothetical protein VNX86_04740 [Rhizomicrobium sp.]|jgi:hypothetical protein|nr:hypothetical protein [Rhizomicrobium sp.]